MTQPRFALLLLIFATFHKTLAVDNTTTSNITSRPTQTSYATRQSMNSKNAIPLTLHYLFDNKHERTSPSARGVYAVRDIIIDAVNRNPTVLPQYNVSMSMWNTQYSSAQNLGITIDLFDTHVVSVYNNHQPSSPSCDVDPTASPLDRCAASVEDYATSVIVAAIKASRYTPPLFFGPETSDEADIIGQLAPLFNVVTISAGADAAKLSNRKIYPNFFRTVVSSDSFQAVPRALFTYLNYTTVALAAASSADNDDTMSADTRKVDEMEKVDLDLRLQKMQVLFRMKFDTNRVATLDEFSQDLQQTDARILVIFSNRPTTYRLFCRALQLVEDFSAKKYLVIVVGVDYVNRVLMPDKIDVPDCSFAQLDKVLNGSLIITHTSWANDNDRLDCCNNMTIGQMKSLTATLANNTYGEPHVRPNRQLPQIIDAFWAGLLALDGIDKRLRSEMPAARSLLDFTLQSADMANMLKDEMNAMRFRGALGEVAFTATGEFDGRLLIRQNLITYNSSGRIIDMIDRFSFLTATNKLVLISPPVFGTHDGRPPADKKPPTVDNAQSRLITILVCTIGGALLILGLISYFLYRRNIQQNYANPSWLIPYDALVVKAGVFASRTSLMGGANATGSMAGNQSALSLAMRNMKVATLNEQLVRMQLVPAAAKLHIDMHNHRTLTAFRDKMIDPNVVRFIGYTVTEAPSKTLGVGAVREQYLLWEHCEKGSLEHLIGGEVQMTKLDSLFEYSILLDVAQGVGFIHKSFVRAHGALSTAACLIDKRFSIKVADYGDSQLAEMFGLDTLLLVNKAGGNISNQASQNRRASGVSQIAVAGEKRLYWAPELLRDSLLLPQHTQEADVYAYAIVVYALITRMDPYEAFSNTNPTNNTSILANGNGHINGSTADLTTEKLLELIRERNRLYRPSMQPLTHCDARLQQLVQRCWAEHPGDRPAMPEIIRQLQVISGIKSGGSVTDQLLLRLERYASDMESLVAERTQELETEKRRTDELLNAMLPAEIAKQLKINGRVEPESFDVVTIYFSDIVGFTTLSGSSTPIEVVNLLNALYTMFDAQIDLFDAYKVETIGDAYMVVSGLPRRNGNMHVVNIAKLSLALLAGIQTFVIPHRPDEKLKLRIGLNTGPCVAGVVGIKMPRYCLFGDTVNTASRMESNGEALRIHISESTKRALDEHDGFVCEERGQLEIKGKGTMTTYWLIGDDPLFLNGGNDVYKSVKLFTS